MRRYDFIYIVFRCVLVYICPSSVLCFVSYSFSFSFFVLLPFFFFGFIFFIVCMFLCLVACFSPYSFLPCFPFLISSSLILFFQLFEFFFLFFFYSSLVFSFLHSLSSIFLYFFFRSLSFLATAFTASFIYNTCGWWVSHANHSPPLSSECRVLMKMGKKIMPSRCKKLSSTLSTILVGRRTRTHVHTVRMRSGVIEDAAFGTPHRKL